MAERLFKQLMKEKNVKGIKVNSKGLFAQGDNISENAKVVLRERGANYKDRKSIKLKKVEKNVLYIAMTDKIKREINGKVISAKDLIGYDISDPFGQNVDVYRKTLKEIEKAEEIFLEKVLKVRSEKW